VPAEVFELLVPHGAITVDGISFTVNAIPASGVLQISIIEYTERHTNIGDLVAGSGVHLESDVVAKQVRTLLQPYRQA
jgi:riboflavin synthase